MYKSWGTFLRWTCLSRKDGIGAALQFAGDRAGWTAWCWMLNSPDDHQMALYNLLNIVLFSCHIVSDSVTTLVPPTILIQCSHAAFFYKCESCNRMILAFIISTYYSKISRKGKAYTKILTSWLSILRLYLIQHHLIIF